MNDGWMITTGTPAGDQMTDQQSNDLGIALMHAYTVLGTYTLSDGTRLVRIRNPWGEEGFHGDWSDASAKWTSILKNEVDYVNDNDGMYYISIEDYHRSMESTTANPNIDGYHQSHYAAFEVDTTEVHVEDIIIRSDSEQMVYISAYTYDSQHIRNGDCYDYSAV